MPEDLPSEEDFEEYQASWDDLSRLYSEAVRAIKSNTVPEMTPSVPKYRRERVLEQMQRKFDVPHRTEKELQELTPRYLLIDAIFINQQDAPEKARQIPFMSKIYSKAWDC